MKGIRVSVCCLRGTGATIPRGQLSLPAAVRRRWHLGKGGQVDVIDLGFGVLTVPAGTAGRLLDQVLPADVHYANVASEVDEDLRTT